MSLESKHTRLFSGMLINDNSEPMSRALSIYLSFLKFDKLTYKCWHRLTSSHAIEGVGWRCVSLSQYDRWYLTCDIKEVYPSNCDLPFNGLGRALLVSNHRTCFYQIIVCKVDDRCHVGHFNCLSVGHPSVPLYRVANECFWVENH